MALTCPTCERCFEEGTFCPFDGSRLLDPERQGQGEPDPLLGKILAQRYLLEKRIGAGGMGTVYLGRHVAMEKPVAVKVLRAELAQDPYAAGRFKREARSASRIEHENCIAVTDFGQEADGTHYLVMEYVEGRTLWQALRERGPLPLPLLLDTAIQIARALNAAHQQGVIHRDLKPENVMLVQRDEQRNFIKVLDFGLAKVIQTSEENAFTALTRHGMIFGTPRYMSPEQIEGREVDPRTDLYAFGVMLYEMATGKLPFEDRSVVALLNKHVHDQPIPPSLAMPELELPVRLEQLILQLMAKKAADRPGHAREVLRQLEELEEEQRASGSGPDGRTSAFQPATDPFLDDLPRQRSSWLVPAFLGGVAATLATVLIIRFLDETGDPSSRSRPGFDLTTSEQLEQKADEGTPTRPRWMPDATVVRPNPVDAGQPAVQAVPPTPERPKGGTTRPLEQSAPPRTPEPAAPDIKRPPRGPEPRAANRTEPIRRPAQAPQEPDARPRGDHAPPPSATGSGAPPAVARPAPPATAPPATAPPATAPPATTTSAHSSALVSSTGTAAPPHPVGGPATPDLSAISRTMESPPVTTAVPKETEAAQVDRLLREARAAMARRDKITAAALLTRALSLANRDARVHYELANLHFEHGNLEAALSSARRASQLNPGSTRELVLLGQLAYKRKDLETACRSFREVLRMQPGHTQAQDYLRLAGCP